MLLRRAANVVPPNTDCPVTLGFAMAAVSRASVLPMGYQPGRSNGSKIPDHLGRAVANGPQPLYK